MKNFYSVPGQHTQILQSASKQDVNRFINRYYHSFVLYKKRFLNQCKKNTMHIILCFEVYRTIAGLKRKYHYVKWRMFYRPIK